MGPKPDFNSHGYQVLREALHADTEAMKIVKTLQGMQNTNLQNQENLNKKWGNASAMEGLLSELRNDFEPVKAQVVSLMQRLKDITETFNALDLEHLGVG